jgi:DNA mismatch repair protein MLH3
MEQSERSFEHFKENNRTWLRQIGGLPQGILDMINSRACRSAIMFNDALSLEECEELVQKVASCAFPFQCAHGRPSMVPLIDLELAGLGNWEETEAGFGLGSLGHNENEPASVQTKDFAKSFRRWQDGLPMDEAGGA